jgi:hypothetical protein|tara:strand:- start:40 stop:369 length:330 start_codon:yes stop_codon:yes gene_type:complete
VNISNPFARVDFIIFIKLGESNVKNKLLRELHDNYEGVVASSDWTNGSGRFTTKKAIPENCAEIPIYNVERVLKGEVLKKAKRLIKQRPKIQKLIAIINLRKARKLINS